jgi:hypothetical protein
VAYLLAAAVVDITLTRIGVNMAVMAVQAAVVQEHLQRRAKGVMEQQTPAAAVVAVLLVVLPVQTMVVEERVVLELFLLSMML